MRSNHVATPREDGNIQVEVTCRSCTSTVQIVVSDEQYNGWIEGALVQTAFPDVPREQRETFVSGTCSQCWQKMFGPSPL